MHEVKVYRDPVRGLWTVEELGHTEFFDTPEQAVFLVFNAPPPRPKKPVLRLVKNEELP
jgi:hypothetical protein